MRIALLMTALLFTLAPAGAQLRQESDSPFATRDPLARALTQGNVVVGRTMQGKIDESALRALADRAPADRPLKIAVLTSLPREGARYRTGARYIQALHRYLGMKRGTLLVVTRKGVYAYNDALPASEISAILRDNASSIQSNPEEGIRRTVEALEGRVSGQRQAAQRRNAASRTGIWLLFGGVGVIAAVVLGRRAAEKIRRLQEASRPVTRLRGETLEGVSYADTYLDLLPDSPDAAAARQARAEAARLLEQADGYLRSARTPEDFGRAQAILEEAKAQADACRSHIDRATGGTGFAVAVEGTDYKATPATDSGTAASRPAPVQGNLHPEDIPENERAACFFCSRPARIQDLTPVTIAMDGQRRKVLACPEDIRIVREGATPEIRTVEEDGQHVPWFGSRRYDPYRDYGRYEPAYAPGYGFGMGGGGFGSLLTGMLLGQMLGGGWHTPYPVFINPGGQATSDPRDAAGGSDGGAWGGDLGPEPEHVGGADFFGTGDGNDFGGGDFDGGDFGGGDIGGGDIGGGDFGGGGGDF